MVIKSTALDDVFHALADPTRRRIVEQLANGEQNVMGLARQFDMSQPAVTKHLNVLERAGLIRRRAVGRTRICRLHTEALEASRQWIDTTRAHWETQLDALERFLATRIAKEVSGAHPTRSRR